MSKVYILGGAQTDFSRNWSKENKNVIALLREVIDDGLNEVGITYEEIAELNKAGRVAVFVGNFIGELYINQGHLGALITKIHPSFSGIPSARYESACASGSSALDAAITKLRVEDYDLAIVLGWELMKSVTPEESGDFLGKASYYVDEAAGVSFPFPKLFGRLADETIKKYKLDTNRYMNNLASISTKNYNNAKKNPNAQTRSWFMNFEKSSNRDTETNPLVGGRLAVTDCSQVTDGAAVVFLANKNFTKIKNKKLPIVKGWGHRVAPMNFSDKIVEGKDNEYILPWTRQAVLDAYKKAELDVNDIDVFEVHDCFTSSEYFAISALGITLPGKEYEVIENGDIFLDGKYPINPSGGLIGCGHPVGASGVRMFLDLFKQVTNKAHNYQVSDAKNGLMLNLGGTATTNYVYIIGEDEE